jgi:hypothetical protein
MQPTSHLRIYRLSPRSNRQRDGQSRRAPRTLRTKPLRVQAIDAAHSGARLVAPSVHVLRAPSMGERGPETVSAPS